MRPDYPVRTARLALRPVTSVDAEDMLAYCARPDVVRYVPFEPMDMAEIARRIAGPWSPTNDENRGAFLVVTLADEDRAIGDVSLVLGAPEHRGAEIGWMFNPAFSGQGYATEAAHAMLHLAFDRLGLHRVTARIDVRNAASARLAERLGMRREAHLIENEWFKGGWSSEFDYALLQRAWAAEHAAGAGSCRWPLAT